jgi:hypothetical protein
MGSGDPAAVQDGRHEQDRDVMFSVMPAPDGALTPVEVRFA